MLAIAPELEQLPAPTPIVESFLQSRQAQGGELDALSVLQEVRQRLQLVADRLGRQVVTTDQERVRLRETATKMYHMAVVYYDLHETAIDAGYKAHPVIGLVEDIAVLLEDLAESAALAGSEDFAKLVHKELAPYLSDSGAEPNA